jgi:hypothetical protein
MITRFNEGRRLGVELGLWNVAVCDEPQCDLAFPIAFDLDWVSTGVYGGENASGGTVGLGLRVSAASIHQHPSLELLRGYGTAQLVAWGILGYVPYANIDRAPAGGTLELRLGVGPSVAVDEQDVAPGLALSFNLGLGWAR